MSTCDFTIELPCGPPPILPPLGEQFEAYLTRPQDLPLHNAKNEFKFWSRKIDLNSLYHVELSPLATTLKVDRDPISGELIDFYEVPVDGIGQTSKNSTSFTRTPGKVTDDVRGSCTNYPFWPGGFDPPAVPETDETFDINFDTELLNIAPGLSRGFDFTSYEMRSCKLDETLEEYVNAVNLRDAMEDFGNWSISAESGPKQIVEAKPSGHELEEAVIPQEVKIPVLNISKTTPKIASKTEFAELLDTTKPVVNFEKKIPDPAVRYDFELDTFQKLAILKLENSEHVFVAAHTSAGKTVVAEYAIGLSQKHCTKTIYTSPIKALSNQKYRDFKNKFNDVGLITGDFRVNQQASCLIMTTEILRSMLYGGSDIIRDVEFVIFDEVHYINDSERGHVWEEIVIMLPSTVCIVMLSATVPNELDFADWVGRTKQAKMFVVRTVKRPVPLQHFLYTGHEGKNENLFLIKNAEGPFILEGYNKAKASLEKKSEVDKTKGPKTLKPLKPSSEKQYWISFVKYLKKHDKLPVVAFTLSRAKCDRNADMLAAIDLTTSEEKNYISHVFKESINTLKEEDRRLPQIVIMELLLSNGIAKHHSGILPILKEIVEILFQKGLVKFLFATETFAMGVNMPAKTVAFDSIHKFDGSRSRCLEPAEYIQMAGRAGRRGQDDTGTVIILCKQSVENDTYLKNMMTGLPTKLESQFRVTYSMILNLLRVKSMSVEDIMSHSFKELPSRRQLHNYQQELNDLQRVEEPVDIKNKSIYRKLEQFYETCAKFIESWDNLSHKILGSAKMQKELFPGRFIVVTCKEHINKLALILRITSKYNSTEFRIMLLCDIEESICSKECDTFYRMLGLARENIFVPNAKPKDLLLTITTKSVIAVTKYQIKIDFGLVLKDCDQRQIDRFKDNPPSQTCQRAITELIDHSHKIQNEGGLKGPHFLLLQEMRINNINLNADLGRVLCEKSVIDSFNLYSEVPDFESQFKNVFFIKEKEARRRHLEYLLSSESLELYPDYQEKIQLLRHLKYINQEDIVEMKGKVACEMGSNELIITELIFNNSLSKYDPSEIAALLSCLVFQVRTNDDIEPELTERLKEGIETIKQVNEVIGSSSVSLNFGLVQVVYEWAHGKPFAQIMELVEDKVQEGIIVRCIQQLNEILCDIKDAAKLFGDLVLKKKMEEASEAIKRDIVFAASLYTR